MRQAELALALGDCIVGGPKVGDQNALERLLEKLIQGGTASAGIDRVDRGVGIRETPKPMCFPVDPPAGFVSVENRGLLGFPRQWLVPGANEFGEPMPHRRQSPRRKGKLEMVVQHIEDLPAGETETVVPIGAQRQRPMADGRFRQGIRHWGFDKFLAVRAIIPMNRVFGDFGLGSGKLFNDPVGFSSGRFPNTLVARVNTNH